MPFTQGIELTLQGAATGVTTGVVIAKHAGQREGEPRQASGNAGLAIAEVSHHQQRIWRQQLEQLLVNAVPLPVQISGDGDAELCQTDA
jgi:hypothetical protein